MIDLFKPYMNESVLEYLEPVLSYDENGRMYIGQGAKVELFEQAFQFLCALDRRAYSVNSGTAALELACQLIGIKPGDEVITTPTTCTATQTGIFLYGATPVWADVIPATGLIDPQDVARKITERTRAIIAVNWGGDMPDYAALKSFGIPVIEDAAHGPYESRKERGDYIMWSLQAIKFLTTIDGGMLYVPERQEKRTKLLRWYGLDRESKADFRCEQDITEVGRKLHMNDVAATIGLANIKDTQRLVKQHNDNALFYSTMVTNPHILLPQYMSGHPYWIYTILVEQAQHFKEYMEGKGIMVSPVHARNDTHTAMRQAAGKDYTLPGVDYFDTHHMSIPVGWYLTKSQRDYIVEVLNEYNPT